ncbi:dihydrofolate reductase [Candidatus Saccharibacteria bacterium]|nr:dihydrofolate reductase [Candidatus Saccharibacteria bacterium]
MISLIAAVGKNWELGKNGDLIFHIKEDMRYFKETTMGHKVVMGRKTWESLPRKLPGRENIVASRGEIPDADLVIHDLNKYLQENENTSEEIFIIGGGMVYFAALPYAKYIYLTEVEAEDERADSYFPEFDKLKYNREVIKEGKSDDLAYTFVKYTKK